jgi:hypothetical protein
MEFTPFLYNMGALTKYWYLMPGLTPGRKKQAGWSACCTPQPALLV